eukprot:m.47757 g.47757  ORF g.47757 m.47757 type:complete len:119 (-) comp12663_c0_seq1:187-543(-)
MGREELPPPYSPDGGMGMASAPPVNSQPRPVPAPYRPRFENSTDEFANPDSLEVVSDKVKFDFLCCTFTRVGLCNCLYVIACCCIWSKLPCYDKMCKCTCCHANCSCGCCDCCECCEC